MILINNPISEGWYADPEARFYENEYWIYATRSLKFEDQLNLDCFHSIDGKQWVKEESIIDMTGFPNVKKAVWAPTIIEKNNKYYLIFADNDIHSDEEPGGLEIAVSTSPKGPFKALMDKPLVGNIINGAQPIDAHLFKDDDGTIYLYYGGWGHCNIGIINDEMTGFKPLDNGLTFMEITPEDYVEGPCMLKKDNIYYFMWSKGNWTKDSYGVCYGKSSSPFGPFNKIDQILKSDYKVAKGPGHHGYIQDKDNPNNYYIVYHRRPLSETDGNSRQLCIDKLIFKNDEIQHVEMT